MIPNINQITAKLATLDDAALQQYAQLHQEDPYILALSVSEKNRRAALRNSATAQQGAQPTVAEQEIAGMQPAGIAMLPAPALDDTSDVETAAAGGIIGYAGGGEIDLEKQREADREWLRNLFGGVREQSEAAGRAILDVGALPVRGLAGAYDTAVVRPMRAAGINAGYLSPALTPEGASVESATPFMDVMRARKPAEAPEATLLQPAGSAQNRTALNAAETGIRAAFPANAPTAKVPPSNTQAGRGTPPGQGGIRDALPTENTVTTAPVAGAQPAAAAQPAMGGLQGLLERSEQQLQKAQATQMEQLKAYNDSVAADKAAELAEFEERTKRQNDPFAEKRSRIESREQELEKQQKSARAYAIIRAGLAMMSGESPYALVNIGRGAQEGLNQYAVDTQRIDKAREGLREELDRIADLQFQMRSATEEKRAQLKREINSSKRDADKRVMDLFSATQVDATKAQRDAFLRATIDATTKEIGAQADFGRQMELKKYERGTLWGKPNQTQTPLDFRQAQQDKEIAKEVLAAAQKDTRWVIPAKRQEVLDEYDTFFRNRVKTYGNSAFIMTPEEGDKIRE